MPRVQIHTIKDVVFTAAWEQAMIERVTGAMARVEGESPRARRTRASAPARSVACCLSPSRSRWTLLRWSKGNSPDPG